MEPSTIVRNLPHFEKLRAGQQRTVLEFAENDYMSVRLPTGYGKTRTAMACFALKQRQNKADSLLIVVPTDYQKEQLVQDGASDLALAGVEGPHQVWDLGYFGVGATMKAYRSNKTIVFVTTIQGLSSGSVSLILPNLMERGKWMVVLDECHHYGVDKHWSRSVERLPSVTCRLAMSATPFRPGGDEYVGAPKVEVTYYQAAREGAVKPLVGHAYKYRAQFVNEETKEVITWTTGELEQELGDNPGPAERARQARKLRWSSQYASPLITQPLFRLQEERLRTGLPLQGLIGCMCVSHAEMVCDLVRTLCPDLAVDWVGTGKDGRSNEENRKILAKFCPKKDDITGLRKPNLDVLVHVGMAGEGVDCLYVTEVVFLRAVNITNSDLQMIGRGARMSKDMPKGLRCHVSFDDETALRDYIGTQLIRVMDGGAPVEMSEEEKKAEREKSDTLPPIPDEPWLLRDAGLVSVDKGDAVVLKCVEVIRQDKGIQTSAQDLLDMWWAEPKWRDCIVDLARRVLAGPGGTSFDERSACESLRKDIDQLRSVVTRRVLPLNISVATKSPGDIKKLVNKRASLYHGNAKKGASLDTLKAHYTFYRKLLTDIEKGEVPSWLVG